MAQLITLSTPTWVKVDLGWGCGWAVTIEQDMTIKLYVELGDQRRKINDIFIRFRQYWNTIIGHIFTVC